MPVVAGEQGQQGGGEQGQQGGAPQGGEPTGQAPGTGEQQGAGGQQRTASGQFAPQGQQQGQQQAAGEQGGEDPEPWADPDKARREIERLRRERGDERINAKTAAADEARTQLLQQLTAVLDPNAKGGEAPTVESLTATVTETQGSLDAAQRRVAILEAAWDAGVDRKRMGYLSYLLSQDNTLSKLPVSADAFAATLTASLSREIDADPTLKGQVPQVVSGAQGFSGAGQQAMSKAEFDALSIEDRTRIYRDNPSEYQRLVALR